MSKMRGYIVSVKQPMTTNDRYETEDCNAVSFKNSGNTIVVIDYNLTLYPGEAIEFGDRDVEAVFVNKFSIRFGEHWNTTKPDGSAWAATNKLDIVETKLQSIEAEDFLKNRNRS